MIEGKRLTVITDGDIEVTRKLVSVENGLYFVCKEEEFVAAKREGREPVCIGFRPEYVKGATLKV